MKQLIVGKRTYTAVSPTYWEAEVFAGDQHLGFLVAKTKQLLEREAGRVYEWSKEDFAVWSPGEDFGPLRIEAAPFIGTVGALEGLLDDWTGNLLRDENNRTYVDDALTTFEETGVFQE